MNGIRTSLLCVALAGCAWVGANSLDERMDFDGDSYVAIQFGGEDCNDADDRVYPGALDQPYDGTDSDCDGLSDFDQDGDGADAYQYGGTDCDDADAEVLDEVS